MRHAVPAKWFSWNSRVFDECCVGWLTGEFLLTHDGRSLAVSTKTSAFVRTSDVVFEQKSFTLKAAHAFRRDFILLYCDHVVGHIRPASLFTRRAIIDLPDSMAVEVRVFLLWLVVLLWRRQRRAS